MQNRQTSQVIALAFSLLFFIQNQSWSASPPAPDYKYRVTQQVCRQLATAFGEQRLPKLTLVADPASQRIAQFVSRPEPELFLDEKLYDICRHFGPDSLSALALVLGHELTHYYGKHADWFGFAQLTKRQQPTPAQAQQTQVLEAQADMQGVYRAFLAGYDAYRLVKPLYMAIYTAYRLPTQMTGYPSREERILLMEEQARKANSLGMAFEAGLFFLWRQDYPTAQRCFTFVSEEMPTKELLMNIGLCQLLRAAQLMTLYEMPFRYPFEVETGNRLRPEASRGDELNKTDLLKQAIANFRQALELDETYVVAAVNLATALSMLGRTGTAKETIDQLEEVLRQNQERLPPNARLVRGIALIEAGKSQEGLAELAQSRGAYELRYNLEVATVYAQLNSQPAAVATQALTQVANRYARPASGVLLTPEGNFGTISLPFPNTFALPERLAIPEPGMVRIQGGRMPDGALYRITLANGSFDLFVSRPDSHVQTKQGIKSGDSVQALIRRYGEPPCVVAAANGLLYYRYDPANLVVVMQDGVVRNWLCYVPTE
ncbi:M48 family metalloprotease [Spirosoma koreense]